MMLPRTLLDTAQPWEVPPRFAVTVSSPLAASEWTWRLLAPHHPAVREHAPFLRRADTDDVLRLISDRYGDPTAYCIMGGNVAGVLGWAGLSFDEQYYAVTHGAGAFPCGTMCYLRLSGPDAAPTLDLLTPRRVGRLEVGRAMFVVFTTPEGTVDTEGIALREGSESYLLSIGGDTRPPTWIYDAAAQYRRVRVEDVTPTTSTFNIKGPRCIPAMIQLLDSEFARPVAALPSFSGVQVRTRFGADAWVLRTVIGIEMWTSPEVINDVWRYMLDAPETVTPCGWEVLATYRLECSDIAFHVCPLDIHRSTYLHDVGLSHVMSRHKETPFIGRTALRQPELYGGDLWVAGLAASGNALRRAVGEPIRAELGGPALGFVTTAGYSPAAGRELCFAHVPMSTRPGDSVLFDDGTKWHVRRRPVLQNGGASLPLRSGAAQREK